VAYRSLTPACAVGASDGGAGLAVGDCVIAADQAGDDRCRGHRSHLGHRRAGGRRVDGAGPARRRQRHPGQQCAERGGVGGQRGRRRQRHHRLHHRFGACRHHGHGQQPAGHRGCGGSCAGHAFTVSARNAQGTGASASAAHVISDYSVVLTLYEPQTQPNNSIFTGRFTLDSTTRSVSGLTGSLTESMTDSPMRTVA
jgi:hypothetical protein